MRAIYGQTWIFMKAIMSREANTAIYYLVYVTWRDFDQSHARISGTKYHYLWCQWAFHLACHLGLFGGGVFLGNQSITFLKRVFQHSITQRNATQRNPTQRNATQEFLHAALGTLFLFPIPSQLLFPSSLEIGPLNTAIGSGGVSFLCKFGRFTRSIFSKSWDVRTP